MARLERPWTVEDSPVSGSWLSEQKLILHWFQYTLRIFQGNWTISEGGRVCISLIGKYPVKLRLALHEYILSYHY